MAPMKPRVYVETSIISYLAARPSRDLVTAARQQVTHELWARKAADFELWVAEAVVNECGGGDPDAAARRLELLRDLPLLGVDEGAVELAEALVARVPLPEKAAADALHIAIAVTSGMDYLLTWNCTHIANAVLRDGIEAVCREHGHEPLVICTPDELLAEEEGTDG